MRIGISSPIVIQQPGIASEWEADAGIGELATIAEAADRLGYHHMSCSEHVALPRSAESRGLTYWDPLATFGYLAARTEKLRLVTQVLVLGYHHPLEIAKRYGTLDLVSNGRLVLGLGVGSLEEEFELLDAPFTDRGARADEAMAALRASLSVAEPEFHGDYYDYSGMVVQPHAVQDHVPMWVGGRSQRSLRRAVTLGDGWLPFGLGFEQLQQLLAKFDLPEGFEVVLSTGPLDPIGDPDGARRRIDRTVAAGATVVAVQMRADSADHYCEQLATLADLTDLSGTNRGA
ncbi:LLM class F420-dependent oxidoreductase [Enemella sp. A6]|uniref:LLM class F420-dependent oxidoreductase n=1 Tax=Enemella sp. A6 TaxID=3440152 RepID=UPI003EB8FECF